uniref:BACK domain-containing protein n=1 Tax=Angiostrongylus cantonensis TaxID=6313 RepID=A0A158P9G0_ANGCA
MLREAFSATVARDYEKAVSVVRCAVATDYAFGVDDLELMDHVYACILNTSHYDESVIEVCWEWIDALERQPRLKDARVVSSSQLSIYYAYHMISRVQERMPRRASHSQLRADAWRRVKRSFDYLWSAAVQLWKPFELDRLDILCSWSYLALQFSDTVDDDTMELIETAKCQAAHVLATTIVVENTHQANQRIATVERNLKETKALAEKIGKKLGAKEEPVTISLMSSEGDESESLPAKRRKQDHEGS